MKSCKLRTGFLAKVWDLSFERFKCHEVVILIRKTEIFFVGTTSPRTVIYPSPYNTGKIT